MMMIENIQQVKKMIRQSGFVFVIMITLFSCYEPYLPPDVNNSSSYLVVDAFINATDGSATVRLSHTIPLASTDTLDQVNNATVVLRDDSDHTSGLKFQGDGLYSATGIEITSDRKYQLVISRDGKTYQSDLVPVESTPPIDSVSWSTEKDNLFININTHDPTNESRFYRWKFTETWEYLSPYQSAFLIRNDSIVSRPRNQDIHRCWKSMPVQKIAIYTTNYLSNDIVSNFNIHIIPSNSLKLSNKYSILVQQQTLTKTAYTYWQNIKKTTESLGGIYDPLPGAVSGNIHCTTNPERVIGFFSIGQVSEKRIFITRDELISFVNYQYPYCPLNTVSEDVALTDTNPDKILYQSIDPNTGIVLGWLVTTPLCTDCRLLGGGNTIKPPFWKD
jgi:hypothetical protein